jgi:predicted nuclease with TOPRIM domain
MQVNTRFMVNKTLTIVFLIMLMLPTLALPADKTSNSNYDAYNPVVIITVITGMLAIITVVMKGINSSKCKQELIEMKQDIDTFKTDVNRIVNSNELIEKIETLKEEHDALYKTVNDYLKRKVYNLSENINKLEVKVNDLNKYFDDANVDRKEENKQIKQDINSLRDNIREDINDVKDIIMKLMMALKTDDD